jgi:Bifunctional DNA primase/polymerase, N-terminal
VAVAVREAIWQHHRDGWPLLMLPPGSKGDPKPLFAPRGVYDATLDPARVRWLAWFGWPADRVGFNVGGALGHGFVALDIDPAEGSHETLLELHRQGCELPATRLHGTPHGGLHPVYLAPPGTRGGQLGPGVMVRGYGSYIVLPPSVLVENGQEVGRWHVFDDRPAVELPGWILERLDGQATPATDPPFLMVSFEPEPVDNLPSHLATFVNDPPEIGRRSDQVWRFVANVLEYGYSAGQALTLAATYPPAVDKYGPRVDSEVRRITAKLTPLHQHPGRPCDVAGCPNTPGWMGGGGR